MKKIFAKKAAAVFVMALALSFGMTVHAAEKGIIKTGIFAGDIELSGMSVEQAEAVLNTYIEELRTTEITLLAGGDHPVVVTAGVLGLEWANPELVTEAVEVGTHGNVIERYKILKDLEHENLVYPIDLEFDLQAINDVLTNECVKYDVKAINTSLKRENGTFQVVEGQTGYSLDVETSIDLIYDHLTMEWNHEPCQIALDVMVTEPRGSAEELAQVTDVLGSFTTSYTTSGSDRSANVENGCRLIDGITLYPGEEFSTYQAVAPFSEANGYYMAGSYVNGKVVDSLGGGICQVSTTLYNAVLLSELEVTERHNHSMIVTYVSPSADAAIAESSGKDFRFVNNLEYPVYIEGYTENKKITFNIYGKETRDPGHKVSYESEVLEVINPPADNLTADASRPVGYVAVTESAHIGYKARLWKVVTENGVEVSREQINSSSYKMSPRSAVVGVATGDAHAYEEIMAAIGTGSVDHVRNVAAALTAPPPQYEDSSDDE
ncbi:MAG: VanW family protein [Eubacterium sp.]|nr:VanW family protein [Eubacterium sp.]MCM1302853.1 VanW family protein [Butyrivibrio sp.]MCM1343060.1 VanW family protein [Muribaculaceae bacterium]MCM1410381.1 VanW family protein [Lachnospiraceae bacterium]